MKNKILEIVSKKYALKEIDCGDLKTFKASSMKFLNSHYEIEGFGSLSFMEAKGMLGLMKMDSMIINPFMKDAPLLSIDRIRVMGNDIIMIEPYNTQLDYKFDESKLLKIIDEFSDLNNKVSKEAWYDYLRLESTISKTTKKKNSSRIEELTTKYLESYLESSLKAPKCDENLKRNKARIYSDGLLEKGGPATTPVVKSIGLEKTTIFFKKVLFATDK